MRILITGSNGLLGQKIVAQLVKRKIDFCATSIGSNRNSGCPNDRYVTLDITKEDQIDLLFKSFHPTVVINTAAMTNVDACEEDELNCRKINVDAVQLLWNASQKLNAFFIQLSTDFVFDGENGPYKEEDLRNPLSIYAKSKVDSEDLLLKSQDTNWAIIRTIIVFGDGENLSRSNIVRWAMSVLENGTPVSIVNDQFRAPTWADDLAWACISAAKKKAKGVFHVAGPEVFSIYELVLKVAAFYGNPIDTITAVSSNTLNQKAKRPPKTGFILEKAFNILGYRPMKFEESLSKLQRVLK